MKIQYSLFFVKILALDTNTYSKSSIITLEKFLLHYLFLAIFKGSIFLKPTAIDVLTQYCLIVYISNSYFYFLYI